MQSIKRSYEISCQGNDNDYHFKGTFVPGLVFLAEIEKPNEFERPLTCDVYLACASQKI